MAGKHTISIVQQVSDQLCWRYCGEVLYRFKGGKTDGFEKALGKYSKVTTSLSYKALSDCYQSLGFTADHVQNITDVLVAHQPVIVGYKRTGRDAHLVLIIGLTKTGKLILNDGCFAQKDNICKNGNETVSVKQFSDKVVDTFWY